VLLINATGALGTAGVFGPPRSAEPALELLIARRYCGSVTVIETEGTR
jgi:hypothetical protein